MLAENPVAITMVPAPARKRGGERWRFCLIFIAFACGPSAMNAADPPPPPAPGIFERLITEAKAAAKEKYKPSPSTLPDHFKNLNYDAYMAIRFRNEKALWATQPSRFQVQFFHPGYLFQEPVRLHALEDGKDREIPFSPEMYDYGEHRYPTATNGLFLTGLRVLYPVNQPNKMDEVAVFLGSSFFRVLGAHQYFGSSARGLAIDTGEPSGEEFPRFTEFWLEKPAPLAEQLRIYARLDSRRVAGAYQFLVKPGQVTTVEVEACLFLREDIKKLGLAPLTSMFFYGENRTKYVPDFRPEVHDADGLQLETSQHAWQWRPLVNPPKVHQITVFPDAKGFGLMQRDRNHDHYQDLQAHFEARPSYWVEPEGDWGAGRLELVEIPSTEERNDNMVAYWVPGRKITPGQELRFRYKLLAVLSQKDRPNDVLWHVRDTRLQPEKGRTRFVVDFGGGRPPAAGSVAPAARVQASAGKVENIVTQPNEMLGGYRTFFDLVPTGDKPIELRIHLQQADQVISETWIYHFLPQ